MNFGSAMPSTGPRTMALAGAGAANAVDEYAQAARRVTMAVD